jgi:hypothetical protein
MKEIKPPAKLDFSEYSIFLAGSINQNKATDWQKKVVKALGKYKVTLFNPRRDNWDGDLEQVITNPVFKGQVVWELDGQDDCDLIIMYFDKEGESPITLLELGLYASSGKLVVCCEEGFWRKGNVDIVCERFKITQAKTLDELISIVEMKYLSKYGN